MQVRLISIAMFLVATQWCLAQQDSLTYPEFLDRVIREHPVVKQANLVRDIGDAQVQLARGGFDPRFEVDYKDKEYNNTNYYDLLDAQLKVPTWYGIHLKGGFQQSQGAYVNPQNQLPEAGLFQAGIVLSLGEGLWINERMAGLRKAQVYRKQSKTEQQLMVNDVLLQASFAYFEWLRAHQKLQMFEGFLENAEERYSGIRRGAETGELAGIDSLEARISLQKRQIDVNQATVEHNKKRLELSTYLWNQDQPLVLKEDVAPETSKTITATLLKKLPNSNANPETNPQLEFYRRKIEALEIEKRYRFNKLLPTIDLEYNLLSEEPETIETFNAGAYKAGIRFAMPLFLRKERGDYKIADFQLQDAKLDLNLKDQQLEARIQALKQQLEAYNEQSQIIAQMVEDATALLNAELRKFDFGESSIFLINTRETNLIEARLEELKIQTNYLKIQAEYLQAVGSNPLE